MHGRRILSRGDELVIALPAALRREEVIVTTAKTVRVATADFGAGIVDGAAALFGVQELADRFENVVFAFSKHPVAKGYLGVSPFSLFVTYTEMACEPSYVGGVHLDPVITTAVGRAFQTVEQYAERAAIFFGLTPINRAHQPFPSNREAVLGPFYHANSGGW
jgi:hypothetical protein